VSSATQSLLGRLPTEVLHADVVGEMVVKFWEQVEPCLCLETFSSRICGIILVLVDDQVHLAVHLEEVTRQLQAIQDEHRAL
jgi:hypothetical protein